jgi:hypothetical protein
MKKRRRSKGLNEENAVVFVAAKDSRAGVKQGEARFWQIPMDEKLFKGY